MKTLPLLALLFLACSSEPISEWEVYCVAKTWVVARYSETDWEGYTDTWEEEVSDEWFVVTMHGKLSDHNTDKIFLSKDGLYFPDYPPVIYEWQKKHFKEFRNKKKLTFVFAWADKEIEISRRKYSELLKHKEPVVRTWYGGIK